MASPVLIYQQHQSEEALSALQKCTDPFARIKLIQDNIPSWLRARNFSWAQNLQSPQEVKLSIECLREATRQFRLDPHAPSKRFSGTAASTLVARLFQNPEWLTQDLMSDLVSCAIESMGKRGFLNVFASPWSNFMTDFNCFKSNMEALPERAAELWLNVIICTLIDATHAPPSRFTEIDSEKCHRLIGPLIERCGAPAVDESLVGADWTSFLSGPTRATVEKQILDGGTPRKSPSPRTPRL